jgi:hypothetical protein
MNCPTHNKPLRANGGPCPFKGQMFACPDRIFHVYEAEFREKEPDAYRVEVARVAAGRAASRQAFATAHGYDSFEEMKRGQR